MDPGPRVEAGVALLGLTRSDTVGDSVFLIAVTLGSGGLEVLLLKEGTLPPVA